MSDKKVTITIDHSTLTDREKEIYESGYKQCGDDIVRRVIVGAVIIGGVTVFAAIIYLLKNLI